MDEVEQLIQQLKDPDSDSVSRRDAAKRLGKIKDVRAIPDLIETLNDENYILRWEAASALGEIGDVRAVEPLLDSLKDEIEEVRGRAASALGEIGDVRAVEPLLDSLKDRNASVRYGAAWALGRMGDPRAVDPLIDALKDDCWKIKITAARALEEIAVKADVDLSKIQTSLQQVWAGVRDEGMENTKQWAVSAYAKIANAISERKKANMPGEMLPARIKPPKKGVYRTRRVMTR